MDKVFILQVHYVAVSDDHGLGHEEDYEHNYDYDDHITRRANNLRSHFKMKEASDSM